MATKTDALRERYALFSQGDLVGATDLWTDDFVWEGSDESDLSAEDQREDAAEHRRRGSDSTEPSMGGVVAAAEPVGELEDGQQQVETPGVM
jgi:ketosteroid isomerase-like protein